MRIAGRLELAFVGNENGWEAKQVGGITKGGPADLDGRILPGDTLLAVDGVPVDGTMAHERLQNRRRVVGSRCVLTMSRMGQTYDISLPWTSSGMTYIIRDLLHLLLNVRTAIETEFDRGTMLMWLDKVGRRGSADLMDAPRAVAVSAVPRLFLHRDVSFATHFFKCWCQAWAHAIRMQRTRLDGEGYLATHLSKIQVAIFNKVSRTFDIRP